ncbi:MAG: DNA-binding response regulator, partial [Planctomycetes bacterium]|nr:DNA-binding response regulator [Planctomycetota bacterium]
MKVVIIEDDPEIVEAVSLCFDLRWPDVDVVSANEG